MCSTIEGDRTVAREMLFVFAYDISQERVRRRVASRLEKRGTRVQESVFEVRTTQQRAEALLRQLDSERMSGDAVRMYCLTEEGRQRSRSAGGPPIPERTEFWLL
jgi:CRISPR-associated protein Cas2